jgi:HK97 family phage portal protein
MGRVQSLWPLNPSKTIKKRNINTDNLEYEYTDLKGQKQTFTNEQVLHIPGFGYDGLVGYNPISLLREAIGLGLSIEEFDSRFYGHGMNAGGIITYPTALKNEQRQDYTREIKEKVAGLANSHSVMVLDGGSTYQSIGLPKDVSQTLETRMFQKQEMAMFYGIPPFMIGDTEKSTSWGTGIEQQTIGFITFSMLYWFTIWEEQLSASLLSPDEREEYYFEFNADALMRGDSSAKSAYYKNLWQIGGISINEIAKKENMAQVKGGDERFIPVNYMRLSDAGKNFNKNNNKGNNDIKPIKGDKNE